MAAPSPAGQRDRRPDTASLEILLIFETGAETTYFRFMIAELPTLVLLRPGGLPDGTEDPSPPPS